MLRLSSKISFRRGEYLNWKCATAALAVCSAAWLASLWIPAAKGQNHVQWTVEAILRELDEGAKDFHSLSADLERTKVTVVVDDHSTETGTILVRGDKMLLEMKTPDARTILRTGDDLYIYTPGLKRVEEYNLGKNRALVDQFLLLGFGTEGKELRKGYLVTSLGEEKIDEKKTAKLELTPKSDAVRNQIAKIQIWLDESSWLPVQQEFFEAGSGDYSIVRYTKMVRNPAIRDSEFKPRWPKGTEKVKPQGESPVAESTRESLSRRRPPLPFRATSACGQFPNGSPQGYRLRARRDGTEQ
jgi:outer membrane lipoprotein-sorting protein